MKKFRTFALVGSLMLALFAVAPTATAHTCADHYTCDASACKDGEDHEHTDYNANEEDGYCKSEKDDQKGDECWYFDQKWPPVVCRVLEGDTSILFAYVPECLVAEPTPSAQGLPEPTVQPPCT